MTSELTQQRLIQFLDNHNPSVQEAVDVFTPLTVGDYDDVHIAALLATIRTRGETFADILGAAKAFLAAGRPFPITGAGLLDTAGTGGDGSNTINVTTAASLVAAAGGVKMVKCGNRSVSSKSGSADVLEALNIPLDLDPDRAVRQFEASNFTFLFAPAYNPAVAHVQPVRKALRVPTLFNTLGPILAPARPEFQIMGIAKPQLGQIIAEVFRELGRSHALVVHGSGTDEIAVHGPTTIWELRDGEIEQYEITPEEMGISQHPLSALAGGDAQENALAMRETFAGRGPQAHLDAISATAGAMLYTVNCADSIAEGVSQAKELISSGEVERWLAVHEGANYGE
ncbi:anthranilate phosphoribosyltransferase [Corynebacterium sp. 153RC1]|uniref:anthranilate phosphoribosyltransferase n=1 Tax=unclassified Corynebacterium TaxID=2624378 RepID=UPI00211C4F80|nr:anthranilate phosphoribosyltransferase [Corynebacterium sp. 209RC1]MCQ9354963.1 anthranilate phosphoribosyltransferase [Corynebacterium sp. 1222RC1]MCQ9357224.1 anthranilate phosphoribosyltransferase [Corynebacterium sp. 122RC1]MCQ9359399.1 anthranilate phosphoribosyltransferase [Corynebacterium sp. 142RC1]MCQ9361621.1 anthranilate phosphoribosyltransferase [Corynebacterium sp. 153RC1]MCQ9363746.1 anthranilate phosphoribosyltransferase [Corynebacterium sp. 732RC1]MCQ9365536.1 anthranilate 